MNQISLRLKAMGWHFLITLAIAVVCAYLVFKIWFPGELATILGGAQLFLLIIACDITLGPLISLVVYNPSKKKSVLIRDYLIIGTVQLSALIYGLHSVSIIRPIFLVFASDRIEVVVASELSTHDLQKATNPEWRKKSWTGPIFVMALRPKDGQERNEILFSSLNGRDIQYFPKYYTDPKKHPEEIRAKLKGMELLSANSPVVTKKITDHSRKSIGWVPAHFSGTFWTTILDQQSISIVGWIAIDPY